MKKFLKKIRSICICFFEHIKDLCSWIYQEFIKLWNPTEEVDLEKKHKKEVLTAELAYENSKIVSLENYEKTTFVSGVVLFVALFFKVLFPLTGKGNHTEKEIYRAFDLLINFSWALLVILLILFGMSFYFWKKAKKRKEKLVEKINNFKDD